MSLEERVSSFRAAEVRLDAVVPGRRPPPAQVDVVVVGAGLAGISIASRFVEAEVDVALLERSMRAGGVWREHANPFSRVNSTEPGYRLRVRRRGSPNSNHSHAHEILRDCADAFEQLGLGARTYPGLEVTAVTRCGHGQGEGVSVRGWALCCAPLGGGPRSMVACQWAVLCTNRRLGRPRELPVAGEELFAGQVRRGLSGDCLDLDWKGRRVLILGHGPYAVENARTALEHGASHVTFAVRRHGIVCPEAVDYVNYIRDYDESFAHPPAGSAAIVAAWREVYRVSGATPPEAWARGGFIPDGHTVSISDIYFVAHFGGLMRSTVGNATRFDGAGLLLSSGEHVDANVVIKAVGFELNEGNERLTGRSRVYGGFSVDEGLIPVFEAHTDTNFSSGAFGSYLDSVHFVGEMLLRYWRRPELYRRLIHTLAREPLA
jgi:hypothetical protein